MALSERVFSAILAMDAYNRDRPETAEGKRLAGVTVTGDIGLASFRTVIDLRENGFQATYYHWNGKKVIAYRGTDEAPWTKGTGLRHSESISGDEPIRNAQPSMR